MHADLVRASGLEPAFEQGRVSEALNDLVMRRGFPAAGADGHARAAHRVAADRGLDFAVARDASMYDRRILAIDGARLQLPYEVGLRRERLRNDEESARILVQTMDD